MAVSIDRLKQETGITELQLECRIDDNVLRRIAKEFDGWEKCVGSPGLNLSEAQKADVRDCVFLKGHEMGVFKALKFWSDGRPHKTIGDLVNVFMELDELVLAEKLCTTAKEVHSSLSELHTTDTESDSSHSEGKGIMLAQEVRKLEEQFNSLQESAQSELIKSGVTVQAFRRSLPRMSCSIKAEHRQFLEEKYIVFKRAETIDDIFYYLSLYLSFIDFSLLEHIINYFGTPELKHEMTQYSLHMEKFRKDTKVVDILPHLSGCIEPPPEYVRVKMKLDYDIHKCTLEDLEKARANLGKAFSLSKLAFFLREISQSCIVVTCLLPTDLAHVLTECAQEMDNASHNLLELYVDEKLLLSTSLIKADSMASKDQLHMNIKGCIEKLKQKFQKFKVSALSELTQDEPPSMEFFQLVMDKSLVDIFSLMDCYLSFIDSGLLHYVTEHLSNPVRELGAACSLALKELEVEPISRVLPHLPPLYKIPEGYSELKVKVNFDYETTSLKDLYEYKLLFAKQFLISQFDVFLLRIESKPFIIWLINLEVTSQLIKFLRTKEFEFFRSLDMLKLTIDEECIFPSQTKMIEAPVTVTPRRRPRISRGAGQSLSPGVSRSLTEEITSVMKSPRHYRGLAIVIDTDTSLTSTRNSDAFSKIFITLNFSIFKHFAQTKKGLSDVLYAASQLKCVSTDYPIVVVLTAKADSYSLRYQDGKEEISIYEDVIQPLLPPYALNLADNPKIFFINASSPSIFGLYTLRRKVPSEGNFLLSLLVDEDDMLETAVKMLQWELTSSKDSIQDVLTYIQYDIPSMIVVSRLKKSVYFNPPEGLHKGTLVEAEDYEFDQRIPSVLRHPQSTNWNRVRTAKEYPLTSSWPPRLYSDRNVSSQPDTTSSDHCLLTGLTTAHQSLADEITSVMKSPQNSRGLAIIIDIDTSLMRHGSSFLQTFKSLSFSIFRRIAITKKEVAGVLLGAAQIKIKSSAGQPTDYPIVVVLTAKVCMDSAYTLCCLDGKKIHIRQDIVEPLLPSNAPNLSSSPKIFFINASSPEGYILPLRSLNLPLQGNFLVSLMAMEEYKLKVVLSKLQHKLTFPEDFITDILHSIEEDQSMLFISHLDKPINLCHQRLHTASRSKRFPSLTPIPISHEVTHSQYSKYQSTLYFSDPVSRPHYQECTDLEANSSMMIQFRKRTMSSAIQGDIPSLSPQRKEKKKKRTKKNSSLAAKANPNSRGLAIILDLSFCASKKLRRLSADATVLSDCRALLANTLRQLGLAIFKKSVYTPKMLDDIMNEISDLTCDYPIVVIVTGKRHFTGNILVREKYVHIKRNIITPLLHAPHLRENPKIFLVYSVTNHRIERSLIRSVSQPSTSSGGNFIVSQTVGTVTVVRAHMYALQLELKRRYDTSVEVILRSIERPPYTTVISCLKKPVCFLNFEQVANGLGIAPEKEEPSRERIGLEITAIMNPPSEFRGLAIVIGVGLSDMREMSCRHHLSAMSNTLKTLKYAVFRYFNVSTYSEISNIVNAASHLVKYPPDYPIIVAVASTCIDQDNGIHLTCNINLSEHILQPLLPPSAPELASNPKIFLINAYSPLNSASVDASRLILPSEGNFIVSLINGPLREFKHFSRYLIQSIADSSESIEEVLMRLKCDLKMMTVVSHLNEPFFLNSHTHDPVESSEHPTITSPTTTKEEDHQYDVFSKSAADSSQPSATMQQPSLSLRDIEFIKPSVQFDITSKGETYHDDSLGLHIEVPEEAVSEDLCLNIGMTLYGPFQFPSAPISPILVLEPNNKTQLHKPVRITLPHIIQGEKFCARVIKASHARDLLTGEYKFCDIAEDCEVELHTQNNKCFVTFSLSHFCFVALRMDAGSQEYAYQVGCCICPMVPSHDAMNSPEFTFILGVTYFMAPCLEEIMKQFPDYKLVDSSIEFFAVDKSEGSIQASLVGEESSACGWVAYINNADLDGTKKIQAKEINLWSKDLEQLKLQVALHKYPPSFQIKVLAGKVTVPSFVKVQFELSAGDHFCITFPLKVQPDSQAQRLGYNPATGAGLVLTKDHLQPLKEHLWEVRISWNSLAGALSLGMPDIKEIQHNQSYRNDGDRLQEVLWAWINTGSATIHDLLQALDNPTVDCKLCSNKLRSLNIEERERLGLCAVNSACTLCVRDVHVP